MGFPVALSATTLWNPPGGSPPSPATRPSSSARPCIGYLGLRTAILAVLPLVVLAGFFSRAVAKPEPGKASPADHPRAGSGRAP
ncbi:hypothetical protein [Amycolatopsis sulphurea]|uniref:hypothetical protein n=1 Tax=Amycolatopsis sulphurea TaxID=76022 RepID=UPI0011454467|nr:hypothetical protein [Amycolatopsis sulphurea]